MAFLPFTLNIKGSIRLIERPQIMGIVNATPDSFFPGSRTLSRESIIERTRAMIDQGADMIDIGAYSSRPGAADVSETEELRRLETALEAIRSVNPDIPVSVDTFRANVARTAISSLGADIVNDISGGSLDADMLETVASLKCPYILMHMRGTPSTMQTLTDYDDVTADVIKEHSTILGRLEALGVSDIIVDPGFGFAKTVEQNYELMRNLETMENLLGLPLLVGISRKSMLTRPLGIKPDEALNATTVMNVIALSKGASILRVHDVKEARQALVLTGLVTKQYS